MQRFSVSVRMIPLAIALATTAGPSLAQLIRTETELVAVDVVVTDKKGNYVHGLTAKDFHVWEDNKEQIVKTFSSDSGNDHAADQKHFVVLFFDTASMNPGDAGIAQQAAERFTETANDSHRMLSVVNFSGFLRVVQNFTEDSGRVKRALEGGLGGSSQFDAPNLASSKTASAAAENGARDTFIALRNLARSLGTTPGRKAVIFFTAGYPAAGLSNTELTEAIAACNKSNVSIFPIDVRSNRTVAMGTISDASSPRMGRGGRGALPNSAIDTPPPDNTEATRQLADMLAVGTGGVVLRDNNDPFAVLAKIGPEQNAYYSLGYTPPESQDGSCHKLRVKVDREGATVRARSEYCKGKPQQVLAGKPIEKQLENRASSSQAGNIEASMQAPFFYTSSNVARVNVALEITSNALKFEKQKDKLHAAVDILGLAYLADGSVGARFSDVLKLDFDNQTQIDQLKKMPLHYENQFDIAPGQYTLKVAFTSGGQSFGKVERPLTVEPYDKTQFNFSALALSKDFRPVSDLNVDALLSDDGKPLVANGLRFTPYGSNRFKKTDKVAFYAEIYEPTAIAAGLQIRILDGKTGAVRGDSGVLKIDTPKTAGMVPLALNLPVAEMAVGSYVLEVQASDDAGKAVKRTSEFEIE